MQYFSVFTRGHVKTRRAQQQDEERDASCLVQVKQKSSFQCEHRIAHMALSKNVFDTPGLQADVFPCVLI